jgi:hypothetical protein
MSVLQESIRAMMVGRGGFGKQKKGGYILSKNRLSKRETFVDISKLIGENEIEEAEHKREE